MAIRMLTAIKDEKFRKVSKKVTKFDDRLHILLDDMLDTLRSDKNAYGCAAVHVGVLKRVVVIDDKANEVIELINPVVTQQSEETQKVQESSIAGGSRACIVERPLRVTVCANDRYGNDIKIEGQGFLAATLCHEIDHLDGIVYTDKEIF